MRIAVVTSTYNREKLICRLYKSLQLQTDSLFDWIIVDDGSIDKTEKVILDIKKHERKINILYIKQTNKGKARALNYVFSKFTYYDLFVVVDSDDYLLHDAIEKIRIKAELYFDNKEIGGLFFRYKDEDGKIIHSNKKYLCTEKILTRIEHDDNYSKDDGCICYYRKAIQKYKYPEFDNEKYIGPIVLQMEMGCEFKILFSNEIVGIAEYQENGLTDLGRKLRIKNPLGMMRYSELIALKSKKTIRKTKYSIYFWSYYYMIGVSNKTQKEIKISKIYLIPGYILNKIWKCKYSK